MLYFSLHILNESIKIFLKKKIEMLNGEIEDDEPPEEQKVEEIKYLETG